MGALTHNGEVLQGLPADASQINFNKTGTDLNSTQTENAIKEVNAKVNTNADDIDQLKSGLTNLISMGSFTVACAAGKNAFERDTVVLVGENDVLPPNFSKCLCMVSGHSGSLNAPNTIETDGANTFIIQSVSAQNLRVTWLDLSNVPIATN